MRKFTQDYVEQIFASQGYELHDAYVDCKTKMHYTCPQGHDGSMTVDNFKRGKRCPVCSRVLQHDKLRHDYEFVADYFKSHGCKLLTKSYINNKQRLKYVCSCGHVSSITFADFQAGKRCKNCSITRRIATNCKNGIVPCSSQQRHIHELIGGMLNYPVGKSSLDIAFPDSKIYFEYDGSGHNYAVKVGAVSQRDFDEHQKRRTYALLRRGWRCIRMISRQDKLPTDERIVSIFKRSMEELDRGASYVLIDIDNGFVKTNQFSADVDFGEVRRLSA